MDDSAKVPPDVPDRETQLVHDVYASMLGRLPEPAGLSHWRAVIRGQGLEAFVRGVAESAEYQGRCLARDHERTLRNTLIDACRLELASDRLTIVDVGAQWLSHEGHVYEPLMAAFACDVVAFEPLPDKAHGFEQYSARHRVVRLAECVADGNQRTLYINADDATSSLLRPDPQTVDLLVGLENVRVLETRSLPTATLDSALSSLGDVAFLKLDVQGCELEVLRHASRVLERTAAIHIEVGMVPIYEGQPVFSEVERHLSSAGFRFVDWVHECRYPVRNARGAGSRDWLGWGDALFLR